MYEYTIYVNGSDGKAVMILTYEDYDGLQNAIGYLVEGSNYVNFTIIKRRKKND